MTSGQVFGLKTVGGGVLVFYSLTARLSLTSPSGETFEIDIPGYYSSSQTLTSAEVWYAEQFATCIPQGQQVGPQVVADASGIDGRG